MSLQGYRSFTEVHVTLSGHLEKVIMCCLCDINYLSDKWLNREHEKDKVHSDPCKMNHYYDRRANG